MAANEELLRLYANDPIIKRIIRSDPMTYLLPIEWRNPQGKLIDACYATLTNLEPRTVDAAVRFVLDSWRLQPGDQISVGKPEQESVR
jgi:hypothetical protein